jgi:hypothetical protein
MCMYEYTFKYRYVLDMYLSIQIHKKFQVQMWRKRRNAALISSFLNSCSMAVMIGVSRDKCLYVYECIHIYIYMYTHIYINI